MRLRHTLSAISIASTLSLAVSGCGGASSSTHAPASPVEPGPRIEVELARALVEPEPVEWAALADRTPASPEAAGEALFADAAVTLGDTRWRIGDGPEPVWAGDDSLLAIDPDDSSRLVRIDAVTGTREQVLDDHHEAPIRALAASPDGHWWASADEAGVIQVWDAAERRLDVTFTGHEGSVDELAFAADAPRLASFAADRTVGVWDLDALAEVATLRLLTSTARIALSPDGTRALVGAEASVRIYDVATEAEIARLGAGSDTAAVGWTDAGPWVRGERSIDVLALVAEGGTLEIVGSRPLPKPPAGRVQDTAEVDGRLYSSWPDGIRIGDEPDLALAVAGGGRLIAGNDALWIVDGHGLARVEVDGDELGLVATVVGHRDAVTAAAFSADDEVVFLGDATGRVTVWDATSGVLLTELRPGVGEIVTIAPSPRNDQVLFGGLEGAVAWSPKAPSDFGARLLDSAVGHAAFDLAGNRVALLVDTGWNEPDRIVVRTGEQLQESTLDVVFPGENGEVSGFDWAQVRPDADEQVLVAAGRELIVAWTDGGPDERWRVEGDSVYSRVGVMGGRRGGVAVDHIGAIRRYDPDTGERVGSGTPLGWMSEPAATRPARSGDGRLVFSVEADGDHAGLQPPLARTLRAFDLHRGEAWKTWGDAHAAAITVIAVSPRTRRVVTADATGLAAIREFDAPPEPRVAALPCLQCLGRDFGGGDPYSEETDACWTVEGPCLDLMEPVRLCARDAILECGLDQQDTTNCMLDACGERCTDIFGDPVACDGYVLTDLAARPRVGEVVQEAMLASADDPELPDGALAWIGRSRWTTDNRRKQVSLSPDGMWWLVESHHQDRLFLMSADEGVVVPSVPLTQLIRDLPHAALTGDSDHLVIVYGWRARGVRIYDTDTGELLHVHPVPMVEDYEWMNIPVAVHGDRIAWVSAETLMIGDTDGTARALAELEQPVSALAFSHDGARLVGVADMQPVRAWDVESGARIGSSRIFDGLVEWLEVSPDGTRATVSSRYRAWVVDLEALDADPLAISPRADPVGGLTWVGENAVAAGLEAGWIGVWDARDGSQITTFLGDGQGVDLVRMDPVRDQLLVFGNTARARRFEPASDALEEWRELEPEVAVPSPHDGRVSEILELADGRWLTRSNDAYAVWDAAALAPLWSANFDDARSDIVEVAAAPDGTRFAVAGIVDMRHDPLGEPRFGNRLRIHDVDEPTPVAEWKPSGLIASLGVASDGEVSATVGLRTRDIVRWSADGEILLQRDAGEFAFASPDGEHLVDFRVEMKEMFATFGGEPGPKDPSAEETILRRWDALDGEVVRLPYAPGMLMIPEAAGAGSWLLFPGQPGHLVDLEAGVAREIEWTSEMPNESVVPSPDGRRILGWDERELALWDVAAGEVVWTSSSPVRIGSGMITTDGRVVTGMHDGSLVVWDPQPTGE